MASDDASENKPDFLTNQNCETVYGNRFGFSFAFDFDNAATHRIWIRFQPLEHLIINVMSW